MDIDRTIEELETERQSLLEAIEYLDQAITTLQRVVTDGGIDPKQERRVLVCAGAG